MGQLGWFASKLGSPPEQPDLDGTGVEKIRKAGGTRGIEHAMGRPRLIGTGIALRRQLPERSSTSFWKFDLREPTNEALHMRR
jgi:hypothetical protein